jgi:hypothetical protein
VNEEITLTKIDRICARHFMGEVDTETAMAQIGEVISAYTDPKGPKRYTTLSRPPSTFSLPKACWNIVERPADIFAGFEKRIDLPVSQYTFGVITFDRELTAEEIEHFGLREVQ